MTASTVTDIYYIVRKDASNKKARAFISDLIHIVEVLEINKSVLDRALHESLNDFEDAVQVVAAKQNFIYHLITRNTTDYENCDLHVKTPKKMLQFLNK
ncbi:MAG: PIN domain-containing protein [Flavobacteriales bacterium]